VPRESGPDGVWLAPGPEQESNGWESKRHTNVDPDSLDWNSNVGVSSVVFPDGPEVIVVCGLVESST
jgi:hypothetical protein